MSIEHKDNQEKASENSPQQEVFSEIQKKTQQEIHAKTKEFIDQDNQIQEIVSSANLKNPEIAQQIEKELQITKKINELHTEAQKLEKETLRVILQQNLNRAEKNLAELESNKEDSNGYQIKVSLAELEVVKAKGKLSLLDQDGGISKIVLEKETINEIQDKESIRKEFEEIKNRTLSGWEIINQRLASYGIDFLAYVEYEHSTNEEESRIFSEIQTLAESMHLDKDLDMLTNNHSLYGDFVLDSLDEFHDILIKKSIFSAAVENEDIDIYRIIEVYNDKISVLDVDEKIFSLLQARIKTGKEVEMQNFSAEEILSAWEQNPEISLSRSEMAPHMEKIKTYIQKLDQEGQYTQIFDIKNKLDFLRVASSYKISDSEDIIPVWMRSIIRNTDTIEKLLKKEISENAFVSTFLGSNYIIPISLIPNYFSVQEKQKYVEQFLQNPNVSADQIFEYADFLGVSVEFLISDKPNIAKTILLSEKKEITKELKERAIMTLSPGIFTGLVFEKEKALVNLLHLSGAEEKIKKSFELNSHTALTVLFHKDSEAKNPFLQIALQNARDDEFAVQVCSYKDVETLLSLPGAVEKVKSAFQVFLETGNYGASKNLIGNPRFSFLREGYTDDVSIQDILFEKLISASRLHAKEDQEQQIKETRLKNIQESFWVTNSPEKLPTPILATLEKFENQYGDKGRHLIALAITAYGTENPDGFARRMHTFENILNQYNPEAIPDGCKVSMGIEYEVTGSIANMYKEESFLGYKKDIQLVSESTNIGTGADAIHEIALKPNYNPYMLMAEVRLLQEAGFMDLNFKQYKDAPRGYHLSLVGDNGLHVNENMYFLNNLLTMTQLTGVTAGKEIIHTKNIHSKSFENFTDYIQSGERCEIKGMATDSVEQFEKSIMASHYAGIAIQLCDKYLGKEAILFGETGNNPQDFEKMLMTTGSLLQSFASDQERDIVYAWMKLKRDTIDAVGQHNNSFVDSEFHGYILTPQGEYIDTAEHVDVVRNKKLVEGKNIESEEFKQSIMISNDALFSSQRSDFVNALTAVNNIFLKPPQGDENSPVNAKSVLDTKKHAGYGGVMENRVEDSLFDNQKRLGDGYYYVQGASEEMIIHKSQILLNEFYNHMQELLQSKGRERERDRRSQEWLEYNAK
ncbi:MAG: hypothetical protein K9M36_00800 [Candidatus Pacebacteria bacterium]|nr:hypothetical protein [Candidatus Paceibacterota bacterium]